MRCFLAAAVGPEVLAAVACTVDALRERAGGHCVRYVAPDNLHVTLRFLGDVGEAALASVTAGVAASTSGLVPFVARLGALELFPSARRPRVLAIGVESGGALERLAEAVHAGVAQAGLHADRFRFRAHLTIGRSKSGTFPGILGVSVLPAEFAVDRVVVYQSELRPEGPVYTERHRIPLVGRGG